MVYFKSEELCSMEKPIPLVVTNVTNGKLELNPMAVEILNKVKQPVCVISIVGKVIEQLYIHL